MSLERKPAGRPSPDAPTPRTLTVASNPAQRLQELLRREAEQARLAEEARQAEEARNHEPPCESQPVLIVMAPPQAAALPTPKPVPPAAPGTPPPPALDATPRRKEEPVQMIVVVNSERNGPVEYSSIEEMPTIVSLEETHRAFLLSDEWQRRGPVLTRIVRLRRRRR